MEHYATKLHGKPFAELTATEQDAVFLQIVKAAGRPNPKWTARAALFGKVGKGLLIVSLAIAVYNIASSDRPASSPGTRPTGLPGPGSGETSIHFRRWVSRQCGRRCSSRVCVWPRGAGLRYYWRSRRWHRFRRWSRPFIRLALELKVCCGTGFSFFTFPTETGLQRDTPLR